MLLVSTIKTRLKSLLRKHDLLRQYDPRDDLREYMASQAKVRVIVGASGGSYKDWIATDKEMLDLLREDDWAYYFESKPLDAILAEHVWEHLDCREAIVAAQNCFTYLQPGGYIRVAVPDGLHPDAEYIDQVKPGGWGEGSDDHHVLYTYRTLEAVFALVGFEIRWLEYFDERGTFHYQEWSPADGMIMRSSRYDNRNRTRELAYTSIILDARKPV
jgi:predicted SAM-dependent methyltransferase